MLGLHKGSLKLGSKHTGLGQAPSWFFTQPAGVLLATLHASQACPQSFNSQLQVVWENLWDTWDLTVS